MYKHRKYLFFLTLFCLVGSLAMGQQYHTSESGYLFHLHIFRQVQPNIPTNKRRPKLRMDFGMVFSFYSNDPHYTNSTQSTGAYTIGLKEEIPIFHYSSLMVGCDFYKQGLTFDSYYFAKGYSFLYDPTQEIYNHNLSINEMQFPVEYKFSFKSESKNIRTFYGYIGWAYRVLIYDNAVVTNTQTGGFVYEGQDNVTYKYNLFAKNASTMIELGFGYQRNVIRNGDAFFIEFTYKYGISPLIYSGNGLGSNNIQFTLNTLAIKVGLRL